MVSIYWETLSRASNFLLNQYILLVYSTLWQGIPHFSFLWYEQLPPSTHSSSCSPHLMAPTLVLDGVRNQCLSASPLYVISLPVTSFADWQVLPYLVILYAGAIPASDDPYSPSPHLYQLLFKTRDWICMHYSRCKQILVSDNDTVVFFIIYFVLSILGLGKEVVSVLTTIQ